MLDVLLIWVSLACATGAAAAWRGYSAGSWLALALMLGPIAPLALLIAERRSRCPLCAQVVPPLAPFCPACSKRLASRLPR